MQHSRLAAFWTGAGVLATLAVLPYVFAIDPSLLAQLPMPLALVVAAQTAQTAYFCWAAAGQACAIWQTENSSPYTYAPITRRPCASRTLLCADLHTVAPPG